MGCRLGSRGIVFLFPGIPDFFLPPLCPERSGAHLVSCIMFTGPLFWGVKRTDPQADYIPSSVAEFKTEWSYSFTSLHVLKKDNFAFASSAT